MHYPITDKMKDSSSSTIVASSWHYFHRQLFPLLSQCVKSPYSWLFFLFFNIWNFFTIALRLEGHCQGRCKVNPLLVSIVYIWTGSVANGNNQEEEEEGIWCPWPLIFDNWNWFNMTQKIKRKWRITNFSFSFKRKKGGKSNNLCSVCVCPELEDPIPRLMLFNLKDILFFF